LVAQGNQNLIELRRSDIMCRSYGARILYVRFGYQHFAPTELKFYTFVSATHISLLRSSYSSPTVSATVV